MRKTSTKFLVISVLGSDKPGSLNLLMKTITNCGCNIVDSRIRFFGMELAATLLISGHWNELAKLETLLPVIVDKLELSIQSKCTEKRVFTENFIPYNIYISTIDSQGIIYKLTQFFSNENIIINELFTDTYLAPYTQAPMVTITMSISISATMLVADLREHFMLFCDDHNLDVVMEPQKY
ncbi:MAG: Glycine cleavage system transcriptional repressor [Legionellaceae bacterium]